MPINRATSIKYELDFVEELIISWINGNCSYVIGVLHSLPTRRQGFITASMIAGMYEDNYRKEAQALLRTLKHYA